MNSNTKKSDVEPDPDDAVDEPVYEKPSTFYWVIVGLHLLVVALGSVSVFFYFQRSMELEHYQFFPIAFAVFAYVLYTRMQYGKLRESISGSVFSAIFLSLSCVTFVVSIAQYNHYLPTVGAIFVIGSLLVCFQDKETNKSLFPVWLLLLPLVRVPLNFDITLISKLQFFSASLASNLLDFVGISNYTPGAIIQVASNDASEGIKRFDVERACSGVQSLFTLIFCTITVAVWSRRSFVAGTCLVLAGVFWSITMNSVRIFICVAFYRWFDFDVYSGTNHEILGYLILFAAIGLIASTDAMIGFVFGAVDTSNGNRNRLTSIWNRFVAGVSPIDRRGTKTRELSEKATLICRSIWVGLLLIMNVSCAIVLFKAVQQDGNSRFVLKDDLGIAANDLPAQLSIADKIETNWSNDLGSFENLTRNANSAYGPYSSTWRFYRGDRKKGTLVSLDYTFYGWHELRLCYALNGWKVSNAITKSSEWSSSELTMNNRDGRHAFCVFSMFDLSGMPVEPIDDNVGFFMLKLRSKLARELNTTTSFQVQCFAQSSDPFTEKELDSIRQLHRQSRELLRTKVLEKIEASSE